MKKRNLFIILGIGLFVLLTGCSQSNNSSAKAIEGYIQALVAQDANKATSLSCVDWEANAQTELDSFTAVSASLENFSCQETGKDGTDAIVTCTGKIVFDYNGEKQELDLSGRSFLAREEDGVWRMCGYH